MTNKHGRRKDGEREHHRCPRQQGRTGRPGSFRVSMRHWRPRLTSRYWVDCRPFTLFTRHLSIPTGSRLNIVTNPAAAANTAAIVINKSGLMCTRHLHVVGAKSAVASTPAAGLWTPDAQRGYRRSGNGIAIKLTQCSGFVGLRAVMRPGGWMVRQTCDGPSLVVDFANLLPHNQLH